jgi:hypothetical protein
LFAQCIIDHSSLRPQDILALLEEQNEETQTKNGLWSFALGSNNDLYALKRTNTGTGSTEVHVLSKGSGYKSFSKQTGTCLHETPGNWSFDVGTNNDLYAIKRAGTGTKTTEIHVVSAASNYQAYSKQTGTALHETPHGFAFVLAPNNDLYAIKRINTGTKTTEVHVLSAASNYQAFSKQTGTALPETPEGFSFGLGTNNDLFCLKRVNTGTKSTEVHVLHARSNYQAFSLQTGTVLHETPGNFTLDIAPNNDLYAIKRGNTGTKSTEIHVISVASAYSGYSLQTGTVLHETPVFENEL